MCVAYPYILVNQKLIHCIKFCQVVENSVPETAAETAKFFLLQKKGCKDFFLTLEEDEIV